MRIRWGLRRATLVAAMLLFSLMNDTADCGSATTGQTRGSCSTHSAARRRNGESRKATIDDPGAYTRPWTIAFDLSWNPNGEIMEYICQENNLWLKRLLKQVPE